MENAVDALKMAAAILIFIIAIAASFSLFGTAKQTADSIILMRDKQAYLESAEADNGILYTSTEAIKSEDGELTEESKIAGITKKGDRIVEVSDVIATILRYSRESYAVTLIQKNGEAGNVIARFDMNLEAYLQDYNGYGEEFFKSYRDTIANNIKTEYCSSISFPDNKIEDLYKISDKNNTKYGAPWLEDQSGIQERITVDLDGGTYTTSSEKSYEGKELIEKYLKGKEIIEVTNEIDGSKYLTYENEEKEEIKTDLVQQYEKPTVEIVYIIN